jgi:hypothetical protein
VLEKSTILVWDAPQEAVKMRQFFLVLFVVLACAASAEPIDSSDIRVIDGDTIRVRHKQPNVRLVGFNAPETRRAACEAERELGAKATRRVRDIVQAGNLEFVYVACSCPPGTQGTSACNYGRDCGTLKSKERRPRKLRCCWVGGRWKGQESARQGGAL